MGSSVGLVQRASDTLVKAGILEVKNTRTQIGARGPNEYILNIDRPEVVPPERVNLGSPETSQPSLLGLKKEYLGDGESPVDVSKNKSKFNKELWNVICIVCSWNTQLTSTERSRVGKAVKELSEVSATPEAIKVWYDNYRQAGVPGAITPQTIAKTWSQYSQSHETALSALTGADKAAALAWDHWYDSGAENESYPLMRRPSGGNGTYRSADGRRYRANDDSTRTFLE